MDLFGKIFKKIDKVDKSRLVEEEGIKVKQNEISIDLERISSAQNIVKKRLELQ